ncbi:hypothetical protein Pla123a_16560 [Posidoniimonas polymericola]|uniref:Uncharacterized protein n=1 Tax=Posidoniimonas polymericola TaxID=2528002 RepID=A0A5C5YSG8_9BACT|nr:hypothetical protein [Posidoniimonas polymericola]TWT77858.1 hypothetical protein Pla123a_16560 [Posidoniimonas polymericola]
MTSRKLNLNPIAYALPLMLTSDSKTKLLQELERRITKGIRFGREYLEYAVSALLASGKQNETEVTTRTCTNR